MKRLVLCVLSGLFLAGCIGDRPANPAATQPATEISPATTQPYYWLGQPGAAAASDGDFYRLWDACEAVARQYLFKIDRREFRRGLLTTEPMVSKQMFELWRRDSGTAADVTENTLVTVRRTAYFQIDRNPDGTYTAHPKVLVERLAVVEPKLRQTTTYPTRYYYPIRRDGVMEGDMAKAVERALHK